MNRAAAVGGRPSSASPGPLPLCPRRGTKCPASAPEPVRNRRLGRPADARWARRARTAGTPVRPVRVDSGGAARIPEAHRQGAGGRGACAAGDHAGHRGVAPAAALRRAEGGGGEQQLYGGTAPRPLPSGSGLTGRRLPGLGLLSVRPGCLHLLPSRRHTPVAAQSTAGGERAVQGRTRSAGARAGDPRVVRAGSPERQRSCPRPGPPVPVAAADPPPRLALDTGDP